MSALLNLISSNKQKINHTSKCFFRKEEDEFQHNHSFLGLAEDISKDSDPVVQGVSFNVSYLGSCIVHRPSGDRTTAEAVKTIVKMVRQFVLIRRN